jgi:hypothetical protein
MSTRLTTEQQAEMDARWDAAATSLWPKLATFAAALGPDEQGVLTHLVQEALGGVDDTAGYWVHGNRYQWELALGPPPPPTWPAFTNITPVSRPSP